MAPQVFSLIRMLSMFYSEDIKDRFSGIDFINNTIVPDPEGKFHFMVSNQWFAFIGFVFKRFDLFKD